MRLFGLLAALALAGCASTIRENAMLDVAARDYVKLALEIDTHEPGYVDAYFGPEEWRAEAKAHPRPVAALKAEADRIAGELKGYKGADAAETQRAKVLAANASSARFRLDMIDGKKATFVEEATKLFSLKPELKPLSDYDAVIARIDALVPGQGTLAERVDAYKSRYAIPADRMKPVMEAAIAECRKRTRARIDLPADESFDMELVKGKSWGAYNYYKGGNRSLIQINTDLPVLIDRALLLGCHEGYPGHHVQGIFNERQYRQKGWVEYSVAPLYAPSSPMNEGGADFGVGLAFPDGERLKFDRDVLYPLAGLDATSAGDYEKLRTALEDLGGARLTIAQMYLDGEIDRAKAVELIQKYQLTSKERAEQSLGFTTEYRSYVINYGLGEALISAWVDRVAGSDQTKRWAAYVKTISEPTLPSDLQ
jgi:hypothetical protein